MTQILRQSTQVVVHVGPFVDVTDGFTPEVGITLSGADEAELLKAGATTTTDISAATWAAITGADGWYALTLTTSHTDTVGTLTVVVHDDSVCLPVLARFQVVEENVFDAFYAGSAALGTDVAAILTDTGTTLQAELDGIQADTEDIQSRLPAALVGGAMDADVSNIQANVVNASALATDAAQEIRDAILPPINTAYPNIPVYMVDATDGITAETGLTLGVTRSIDGGAFGAGTGTAAEIGNGLYQYDASAADMNGKRIVFRFTATGARDTYVTKETGG